VSADVVTMFPGGAFSREQIAAVQQFENQLAQAVETAKGTRVPQGFIVALLHAFAMRETQDLM